MAPNPGADNGPQKPPAPGQADKPVAGHDTRHSEAPPEPLLADRRPCLALECSTDQLSLALGTATQLWAQHKGPGGAQASAQLLPQLQALLLPSGTELGGLQALVLAHGPGAFTGLRTACAVAQGLAWGSRSPARPQGLPVLLCSSLLALAEAAHQRWVEATGPAPRFIAALLDARMGEIYLAVYRLQDGVLLPRSLAPARLCASADLPAALALDLPIEANGPGALLLAGNVWGLPASDWPGLRVPRCDALPDAAALLRLVPQLWASQAAVWAAQAQPVYVRDQVALTSAQRQAGARLGAPAL